MPPSLGRHPTHGGRGQRQRQAFGPDATSASTVGAARVTARSTVGVGVGEPAGWPSRRRRCRLGPAWWAWPSDSSSASWSAWAGVGLGVGLGVGFGVVSASGSRPRGSRNRPRRSVGRVRLDRPGVTTASGPHPRPPGCRRRHAAEEQPSSSTTEVHVADCQTSFGSRSTIVRQPVGQRTWTLADLIAAISQDAAPVRVQPEEIRGPVHAHDLSNGGSLVKRAPWRSRIRPEKRRRHGDTGQSDQHTAIRSAATICTDRNAGLARTRVRGRECRARFGRGRVTIDRSARQIAAVSR